jgi:hypothetical protein
MDASIIEIVDELQADNLLDPLYNPYITVLWLQLRGRVGATNDSL